MKLWDKCKKGDVISAVRMNGAYKHFAVYIGDGRVIHFAADNNDFGFNVCVREAPFEDFIKDSGNFEIVQFKDKYEFSESAIDKISKNKRVGYNPLADIIGLVIEAGRAITYHLYSPEETVERAKSMLGRSDYNLIFGNCEHFAVWCKTGIWESKQVDMIIKSCVTEAISVEQLDNFLLMAI